MGKSYIPIIDFESCSLAKEECSHEELTRIGEQLVEGFSQVGFVYLKNYGFKDAYIQELNQVTETFFKNPVNEKMRYERKGNSAFGYIEMEKENPTVDPNIPCDYKEAFNINGESFARDKSEWPDDIAPGFSEGILDFMTRSQKLSLRILHALAIGMGLKDEYTFYKYHSKMHTKESYTTAKTLYYPPIVRELKPGQVRHGEHADIGTITLVFQDKVGGLQIKGKDGTFIDATPIEDTVVVNVDDTLQYWTNGKLKSTIHKVVAKADEREGKSTRRSLVYFTIANNDALINKPLVYKDKSLNVKDGEPISEMTIEEWILGKMKQLWDVTENDQDSSGS